MLRVLLPVVRHAGARRRLPALVAARPHAARTTSRPRTTRRAGIYSSSDRLVIGAQMDEIAARGRRRGRGLVVGAWVAGGRPAAGRRRGRARRRARGRRAPRAVPRPHGGEHGRRRRVPAHLRDPHVLRLPRVRPSGRRLGCAARAAPARGRYDALRADRRSSGAAAAAGFDGVYTYDIVTYRRQQVRAPLRAGTRGRAAVRAVRRPRLRRTARERRPGREAPPARGDVRRDVARGDRGARRPRHDHLVQRVARGHADRAGGARAPRPLPLPLLRRCVGTARPSPRRPRTSTRTRYWSDVLRSTSALQPKTRAS